MVAGREDHAVVVWILCGGQGDTVSGCQSVRVTEWEGWMVMRVWCEFCVGFRVTGCHGVRVTRWEGGRSFGCGVGSVRV